MNKKTATAFLLLGSICLSSCQSIQHAQISSPISVVAPSNSSTTDIVTPLEPIIKDFTIATPNIDTTDFNLRVEAENSIVKGDIFITSERQSSLDGYVSGIADGQEDNFAIEFEADHSQHYDFQFALACDSPSSANIMINDVNYGRFALESSTDFGIIALSGIFLPQGNTKISFSNISGSIDCDYVEITDNQSVSEMDFSLSPIPVSPNADKNSIALLNYLANCYGEQMITGQYVSSPENIEMEMIKKTTNKYPAIRLSDISKFATDRSFTDRELDSIMDWHDSGGIISLMWLWNSPNEENSVYSKDNSFALDNAVTDIDIANMDIADIQKLVDEEKIEPEALSLIEDIDIISEKLEILCNAGIPILWRPLHEASGDWYWWGDCEPDSYKWLWQIMFKRQTEYHNLTNLIWVWNGPTACHYVGDEYFDIASMDIYSPDVDNSSYYRQFQQLYKTTSGKKMIALSECGRIPLITQVLEHNSPWLFFGLWYDKYLMTSDGEFNTEFNEKDDFVLMYNCDRTLTRDEVPDIYK